MARSSPLDFVIFAVSSFSEARKSKYQFLVSSLACANIRVNKVVMSRILLVFILFIFNCRTVLIHETQLRISRNPGGLAVRVSFAFCAAIRHWVD